MMLSLESSDLGSAHPPASLAPGPPQPASAVPAEHDRLSESPRSCAGSPAAAVAAPAPDRSCPTAYRKPPYNRITTAAGSLQKGDSSDGAGLACQPLRQPVPDQHQHHHDQGQAGRADQVAVVLEVVDRHADRLVADRPEQ